MEGQARKTSSIVKEKIGSLSDIQSARVRRRHARQRLAEQRANGATNLNELKYAEIECQYAERDVVIAKILVALASQLRKATSAQPVDPSLAGHDAYQQVQPSNEDSQELEERERSLSERVTALEKENAVLRDDLVRAKAEVRRWRGRTVTLDQTMHRYRENEERLLQKVDELQGKQSYR